MENNNNLVIEPIEGEITSELNPSFEPIEFTEAEIIEDEDWKDTTPAFIESNSQAITLEELETKCIVPCFATNELTLSHQEIARNLYSAAALTYGQENLGPLEFRVSHPISGRVGKSALSKDIDQLLDSEKSLWFQRIACCFKVKSMTKTICDQETNFCIGFIRSYHTTNLYSSKTAERISLYCGTRVRVCSNLCLTLSGLRENIQCLTGMDVKDHAQRLIESYSAHADEDTQMLENLSSTYIKPSEFSHLIGRLRYYMALNTNDQKALPKLDLGDQLCNEATRLFVNSHWGIQEGEESINLFRLLQCFNEAAKNSYIHNFLTKNAQCTELVLNLQKVLEGDHDNPYTWFLN